ncbi:hypothetical protein [Yoonia sp. BS5-3]|uniref:MFS transporter n=1 Tax=Yoonia phaeophyticola TaxID=3137369 RepID=A0ABZ2V039_9RHOB
MIQIYIVLFISVGPVAQIFYSEGLGFTASNFMTLSVLLILGSFSILAGPNLISKYGASSVINKGYFLRFFLVFLLLISLTVFQGEFLILSTIFLILLLSILHHVAFTIGWFPLVRVIVHKSQLGAFFGETRRLAGMVKNTISVIMVVLAIGGVSTFDFMTVFAIVGLLLLYSAFKMKKIFATVSDAVIAEKLGSPPTINDYRNVVSAKQNRYFFGVVFSAKLFGIAMLPVFLVGHLDVSPAFVMSCFILFQSIGSLLAPTIGKLVDVRGPREVFRVVGLVNFVPVTLVILALSVVETVDTGHFEVLLISSIAIALQVFLFQMVTMAVAVVSFTFGEGTEAVARYCMTAFVTMGADFLKLFIGGVALITSDYFFGAGHAISGFGTISILMVFVTYALNRYCVLRLE